MTKAEQIQRDTERKMILSKILVEVNKLKAKPIVQCCDEWSQNEPLLNMNIMTCKFCGGLVFVPQLLEPEQVEALDVFEKALMNVMVHK